MSGARRLAQQAVWSLRGAAAAAGEGAVCAEAGCSGVHAGGAAAQRGAQQPGWHSLQQRSVHPGLPKDLQEAALRARFPKRLQPAASLEAAASGEAGAAAAGEAAPAASVQQQCAKIATTWMFPWERRQMEGGALKGWEKLYWGVFVVGISLFLFNRLEWESAPPEVDTDKEARKEEMARLVLAGQSIVDEGAEDPFQGMTPEEIQKYVEEKTGASRVDPFEGMSPEEIDAFISKHGMPAGAG